MKRAILGLLTTYVLLALMGRFVEAMGAAQCECASTCWCKQPGLSLFRWTFPRGHHSALDDGGRGSPTLVGPDPWACLDARAQPAVRHPWS